jgi:hypothetical protein
MNIFYIIGVVVVIIVVALVTLAASNFLGPLLLGRFFDTIGRRTIP